MFYIPVQFFHQILNSYDSLIRLKLSGNVAGILVVTFFVHVDILGPAQSLNARKYFSELLKAFFL